MADVLWAREVRVLRRASFAAAGRQRLTSSSSATTAGPNRDGPDRHGGGSHRRGEEAATESSRVEGVLFTAAAKQHLATLLKQQAEDRRLRIPADKAIRTDLHSLRRVTTPAGNVRFDVDGGDGHADRAWAAALGVYAADAGVEVFDYRPVRTHYQPERASGIRASHADDLDRQRVRPTGGFVRGVI